MASTVVNGQTYLEKFGQNRVQYRKFGWRYFDTKHFRIYHYDQAGRQLARYVSEQAENDISVIERKLGGQFPSHHFRAWKVVARPGFEPGTREFSIHCSTN